MFKIDQSPTYWWQVQVEYPADHKTQNDTFDVQFKRISQSKIAELAGPETDAIQICKEVLVGWKGITDGPGELPYSEGARDRLLDVSLVAGAISRAWFASLVGAKVKN